MAWSDHLRCLHCDAKLPLYRKITSGQFCSAAHSKAYWHHQEQLAVERLHQTHDSLRAYRAPEALEAILGKSAASEPIGSARYPAADQIAEIGNKPAAPKHAASKNISSKNAGAKVPAKPIEILAVDTQPDAADIARSAANTGQVKFAGFLTEKRPGLRLWDAILAAWNGEFALWPISRPWLPASVSEKREYAFKAASGVAIPQFQANGLAVLIRTDVEKTGPVAFATKLIARVPFVEAPETEELSQHFLDGLNAELVPEVAPAVEEPFPPVAQSLMTLHKFAAQSAVLGFKGKAPEPIETALHPQNARCDATFAIPAVAAVTRLQPLPVTNAPKVRAAHAGAAGDAQRGDLNGYSQALELKANVGTPWMNLAIPAATTAMPLAPGSRYPIFGSAPHSATGNLDELHSTEAVDLRSATGSPYEQLATQSIELSLNAAPGCRYGIQVQQGSIQALQPASGSELSIVLEPQKKLAAQSFEMTVNTASLCALAVASQPGTTTPVLNLQPCAARSELQIARLPDGLGQVQTNPVMAKGLRLPFAAAPCAPAASSPIVTGMAHVYAANAPLNPVVRFEPIEGTATPPRRGFLGWTQTFSAGERKHVWEHAVDFWQHAPRDLKLLAVAIPILLGLALRPSLPKVQVTAPSTPQGISKDIGNGFREQFVNVRNSVAQRAAVSLSEDFRSGLDDWQSRGDLSSGWSFDRNGFVRPGTLALYRPSMGLTDYDMEFLGLVDQKALSWVVRAQDFDNYYVVKLVILKSGPLPTLGITRYAVIDGNAQARVDTTVAINARPDMLYRVSMNVHDDTFLLSLQGSVVDNWTDSRLKRGGVGFFAAKGEESRLRWLQLTHQYDMLGRLCAYLAPYNIPTTNGSW